MAQEQVQKQKAQARTEETHSDVSNTDVTNEELAQAVDDTLDKIDDLLEDQLDLELLDEIDDVLEENAEAFVDSFIQQGGE
jgi:ubiquitin-like protein Pup